MTQQRYVVLKVRRGFGVFDNERRDWALRPQPGMEANMTASAADMNFFDGSQWTQAEVNRMKTRRATMLWIHLEACVKCKQYGLAIATLGELGRAGECSRGGGYAFWILAHRALAWRATQKPAHNYFWGIRDDH